jgi:DNA mismatch repair protein MutS
MKKYTPIINQYIEIKKFHKDKILLFRVGDFYELFFEDAIETSKLLSLTLTKKKNKNEIYVPMAGFPVHVSNTYISKLMKLNKKVAICEQTNEIKDGLIKRKVVKIFTPGTYLSDLYLKEDENNFIVCVSDFDKIYGLAILDISTGNFIISHAYNIVELYNEIDRLNPTEIILPMKSKINKFMPKRFFFNKIDDNYFDCDKSYKFFIKLFDKKNIPHLDHSYFKSGIIAAGSLINYIMDTQNNKLLNVTSVEFFDSNDFLYIDINSRKNLELLENINGEKNLSLINLIDHTKTSMGKRLLKRWILLPLLSRITLNDRLKAVTILKDKQNYEKFSDYLLKISDIERLLSKVALNLSKPIDLKKIQISLDIIPLIKSQLKNLGFVGFLETIYFNLDSCSNIAKLISDAISDKISSVNNINFIKKGFDRKLDILRENSCISKNLIDVYQSQEREKLKIKNLKLCLLNNKDYYIEVQKKYMEIIPKEYIKIKSTSKYVRYTNSNIDLYIKNICDINISALEREKRIYRIIVYKIKKYIKNIQKSAKYLSILDVLISFSKHSSLYNWSEPILTDKNELKIISGRHPMVEFNNPLDFIPNDIYLNDENKAFIITGANMGGKSTYMRQLALIVLLSHIGSHVPAKFATIGKIDKIFTRIGAGDDLSNNKSTFMLEMKEIAHILNKATENSLIIIDEIGRGTGYLEGKSLAYAIIKDLLENKKSFFLFSTHFHDLNEIDKRYSQIKNIYCLVKEENNNIKFFYKFLNGYSKNSYGITVAKLSGLSNDIIHDAENIFLKYKNMETNNKREEIINYLLSLNPNDLSPKEALNEIFFLKQLIE